MNIDDISLAATTLAGDFVHALLDRHIPANAHVVLEIQQSLAPKIFTLLAGDHQHSYPTRHLFLQETLHMLGQRAEIDANELQAPIRTALTAKTMKYLHQELSFDRRALFDDDYDYEYDDGLLGLLAGQGSLTVENMAKACETLLGHVFYGGGTQLNPLTAPASVRVHNHNLSVLNTVLAPVLQQLQRNWVAQVFDQATQHLAAFDSNMTQALGDILTPVAKKSNSL